MVKHLCWICDKEIIEFRVFEKAPLRSGIIVEDICRDCKNELSRLIDLMIEQLQT